MLLLRQPCLSHNHRAWIDLVPTLTPHTRIAMAESLYLLLIIAAVYVAGWLFGHIGQFLGSNPTALGWNDEPRSARSKGILAGEVVGPRGEPEWQRIEERTRFPTRANMYGELPMDMPDERTP